MAPVQRFPGDHLLPQLPAAGWDLPATPLGSVSGQYLGAFGDVPVDFMVFFEEINANHSFYMFYCQIMPKNLGSPANFPFNFNQFDDHDCCDECYWYPLAMSKRAAV
jgi:hypothetical protein